MLEALSAMGSVVFDPYLILLILGTTVLGIIIGVLPGLGATTGAALLLPFTLSMSPVHAITVLATIYVSATFAGAQSPSAGTARRCRVPRAGPRAGRRASPARSRGRGSGGAQGS